MMQTHPELDIIQDGQRVNDEIIEKYNLSKDDIFYSTQDETYKSNFVGVVLRGERLLVSLPKHFKEKSKFIKEDYDIKKSDIHLIMDSINKSVLSKQNSDHELKYSLDSNFPLNAYFNIYNYFAKYGLYHEEYQVVKPNQSGRISWKATLIHSNKFISKGNIIFLPLLYKKKRINETIITECMVSIINYTNMLLSDFMTLPDNSMLANRGINNSIFNNKGVIHKLHEILSRTFKDINKDLLRNIIIFLEKVNFNKRNILDIKYYDFANTWEMAVQKYLCDYFVGINAQDEMEFNSNGPHKAFKKDNLHYNIVHKDWNIQPDHVAVDDNTKSVFLFDSKYYTKLNDINHKQFMYHIIYRYMYPGYHIFDRLIMPYEDESTNERYVDIRKIKKADTRQIFNCDVNVRIDITKLNMVKVLKNLVSR